MSLKQFLTCLDSVEYQTLRFLMFPHQDHIWFIGYVFNTPCLICAFSMLLSCIAHSHLLHTHLCYPCHVLVYILFLHPSMSCLFYALQHFFFFLVLGLNFIFLFISHPSCIIIIVRTFISCPRFSLTLCLFMTKRGRVYFREYTEEFCHFYMTLVHILTGRNSISCAHL